MSKAKSDRSERGAKDAEGGPAGGPPLPHPGTCRSTTQYGRPCQNPAPPGRDVCWSHDPEHVAQRAKNARAGSYAAHSPGTTEIQELKDELKALVREVKAGDVAPGIATVITQLSNVILRAIEQDRKVRELDDLEERLAALEGRRDGSSARAAA
ncbi:MAG: hypothetical protein M3Q49_01775 [Actinomycetota bacterium]|nr:hypothetical protein [Actinomycetota bacterium]MDP9484517.1 hypothetical protein [Actinomycetota bacterium]